MANDLMYRNCTLTGTYMCVKDEKNKKYGWIPTYVDNWGWDWGWGHLFYNYLSKGHTRHPLSINIAVVQNIFEFVTWNCLQSLQHFKHGKHLWSASCGR